MAYLNLFRWQNLLVVALTQYAFRYAIILPVLEREGINPALSHFDFAVLVIATLLLCAAGYAINDYFDLRTDRINKPHKIVLGNKLSRRDAIFYHKIFNIIGVILGFYLAYKVGRLPLAGIFIVIPFLLWMYSIRYKKRFLIGNVIISLLAGFVVAIVWVFESQALATAGVERTEAFLLIHHLVRAYAWFAFLATLIREIVKDVEDIKGDAKTSCKTIPIVSGLRVTKRLVLFLILGLMSFVGYFMIYLLRFDFDFAFAYLLLSVQIPFIFFINKLFIAKEKADYSGLSKFSKLIMLFGVMSMLVLYFYFINGYSLL